MNQNSNTALIAGASGLVGSALLHEILASDYYSKIILIVRRRIDVNDSRVKQLVIDFNHLEDFMAQMAATHYFCLLGTTLHAAGSKSAFREIDYIYPLQLGKIAKKHGAEKFLVVTALGANTNSIFFYNQVKGEVEQALRKLHLNALYIFQPSLLGGTRIENRRREKVAAFFLRNLSFLLIKKLKKYRITEAQDLAKAMLITAQYSKENYKIIASDSISKLLHTPL